MDRLDTDAPIACTLNDAEFRERRAFARQRLIPKITETKRNKNGLVIWVEPSAGVEEDLHEFVRLERQCCEFLTFTILNEHEASSDVTGLKIEGPPEAGATIEMFAKGVETSVVKTKEAGACGVGDAGCGCDGVPFTILESGFTDHPLRSRFRRAGWSGVFVGVVAILVCELPIILAALGLGGLSAGALTFRPPQFVETIAMIAALLGTLCLIILYVGTKLHKLRSTI